MKWKLTIYDLTEQNNFLNGYKETLLFFTLNDVFAYIGGRLKKERCGYAGIKGNLYYVCERWS